MEKIGYCLRHRQQDRSTAEHHQIYRMELRSRNRTSSYFYECRWGRLDIWSYVLKMWGWNWALPADVAESFDSAAFLVRSRSSAPMPLPSIALRPTTSVIFNWHSSIRAESLYSDTIKVLWIPVSVNDLRTIDVGSIPSKMIDVIRFKLLFVKHIIHLIAAKTVTSTWSDTTLLDNHAAASQVG